MHFKCPRIVCVYSLVRANSIIMVCLDRSYSATWLQLLLYMIC